MKWFQRRAATAGLIFFVLFLWLGTLRGDPEMQQALHLIQAGRHLTDQQAADFEKGLATKPDDMVARTKLLGYSMVRSFQNAAVRDQKEQNILWIIAHHPDAWIAGFPLASLNPISDGDSYDEGRKLWINQVESSKTNVAILANAARFFTVFDKTLSETYLKRLCALEPANPEWHRLLSELYTLSANYPQAGQTRPEQSAKALRELETAFHLMTNEESRVYAMTVMGTLALDAGDTAKARHYAYQLVALSPEKDWSYAVDVHRARTLLGRAALAEGNLDEAKADLLASANITGSTNLDHFPPEILLAKELVAKGETNTVTKYLEECKTVWPKQQALLDQWLKEIQASGTSTFQRQSNTASLTPDQIKQMYPGMAPPKRSVKKMIDLSAFTSKAHSGYDSYNATLLHNLNTAWRKRDLEWCAMVIANDIGQRQQIIPCVLSTVVWSSLITGDPATSAERLQEVDTVISQIESLAPDHRVESYGQFKTALTNAVATFAKIDPSHRLEALFDAYPSVFPLNQEIMQLSHELQGLLDNTTDESPLTKAIVTPDAKYGPLRSDVVWANVPKILSISELATHAVIAPDPAPELTARWNAGARLSPDAKTAVMFGTTLFEQETQKEVFTTLEPIAWWIQNNRTDAIHVTVTITSQEGYHRSFPEMLIPGAGSGFEYHPGELKAGEYAAEIVEKGHVVGRMLIKVVATPDPVKLK